VGAAVRLLVESSGVAPVLLCAAALTACSSAAPSNDLNSGAHELLDQEAAEARHDRLVEHFLDLVPQDGDDPLVDRISEDVALSCSARAAQTSRFIDVRPSMDEGPDEVVRELASSLREGREFEVEVQSDIRGDARLIARETETGASIVMSQRAMPLFQITAYSPCYRTQG